jgi:hypothetical protein
MLVARELQASPATIYTSRESRKGLRGVLESANHSKSLLHLQHLKVVEVGDSDPFHKSEVDLCQETNPQTMASLPELPSKSTLASGVRIVWNSAWTN